MVLFSANVKLAACLLSSSPNHGIGKKGTYETALDICDAGCPRRECGTRADDQSNA
jgi:hypothetical protein